MSKKSTPILPLLSSIVLINGMIIMIFEIVGARLMSPYFGGSIIVWTSLIGVIMFSLSIGYWLGGIIADKRANRKILSVILLLSAVFTLLGIYIYSDAFLIIQALGYQPVVGSLLASFIVFFLPNLFMGMVLPYVTKLATKNLQTLGATVGKIYAYATIGSIIGTFLAGFVLIPNFNTSDIVIVQSLVLIALSFIVYYSNRIQLIFTAVFLVFILINIHQMYPVFAHSIYQTNSAYNYIYVQDLEHNGEHRRYLMANDNTESVICLNCAAKLDNVYAEYRKIFIYQPDIKDVLIIGGGGYTIANDILANYTANVTVVEIDPVMTAVSQKYFGLEDNPRLTIRHQDGRQFLQQNNNQYDLIILDAFLDSSSIPFHLTTVEFVELLKSHLNDDGFAFLNLVSTLEGPNSYFFQTEYNTYQDIFPHTVIYSRGYGEQLANILFYIAKDEQFNRNKFSEMFSPGEIKHPNIETNQYLTDDWAPVEYFNLNF